MLTKGRKHVLKIFGVDKSIVVVINHREGLLEFGDLFLIEHGEDIGGLTDSSLLGLGFSGGLGNWLE